MKVWEQSNKANLFRKQYTGVIYTKRVDQADKAGKQPFTVTTRKTYRTKESMKHRMSGIKRKGLEP